MNNKEKAKEIAENSKQYFYHDEYECGLACSLRMVQWKDEQLVRAAKNAFCEVCPYGPCPYPVDNGEECKRRLVFGEKVYNNLQEL